MTITIICYNYDNYLPEAIKGVLSQIHKNIEILVIDDRSVDNSREVATATVTHGHLFVVRFMQ